MKIKCQKCQEIFDTDKKQGKILEEAILKNRKKLIFIECPICLKDSYIDPFNLLNESDKKHIANAIIKCPVCQEGIVIYIDDGDERFWGCGECGNIWKNYDEITECNSKI